MTSVFLQLFRENDGGNHSKCGPWIVRSGPGASRGRSPQGRAFPMNGWPVYERAQTLCAVSSQFVLWGFAPPLPRELHIIFPNARRCPAAFIRCFYPSGWFCQLEQYVLLGDLGRRGGGPKGGASFFFVFFLFFFSFFRVLFFFALFFWGKIGKKKKKKKKTPCWFTFAY